MKGISPKKLASNGATAVAAGAASLLSAEQISFAHRFKPEAQNRFGHEKPRDVRCAVRELSRSGANDLITHLEKLGSGRAVGAKILRFEDKKT